MLAGRSGSKRPASWCSSASAGQGQGSWASRHAKQQGNQQSKQSQQAGQISSQAVRYGHEPGRRSQLRIWAQNAKDQGRNSNVNSIF
jgi:hypothetical protein